MSRLPPVLGLAAVIAACHKDAPRDDKVAPRTRPPPTAHAFATGGTPLADAQLERVLRDDLTAFEIALDRGAAEAAPVALVAAFDAHPDLAPAWRELLAIAVDADASALVVRHAGAALSDRFAAAGLGYFIDATRVGNGEHLSIHAYRIDEIRIVARAADAPMPPVRVLVAHRIDGLGIAANLFGMQSEDLDAAVVLTDQITDYVVKQYLDVLAPGAPYKIDGKGWWARRGAKVAAAAGDALRADLLGAAGGVTDAAAASKIGALATERTKLLGDWPAHLRRWSRSQALLAGPFIPEAYLAELQRSERASVADRVVAIEDELAQLGAARIAQTLEDRFADAVGRHEAQHALDAARATPLPLPPAVLDYTRPEAPPDDADPDPDAAPGDAAPPIDAGSAIGSGSGSDTNADAAAPALRPVVAQTALELSAYLSEIASEPAIPHLVMWAVARNLFDGASAGSAELYVAAIIVDGLARHLHIPTDLAAGHDRFDRQYLGAIAIALSHAPAADLRAAAAALWLELYGELYVPVAFAVAPQ